MPLRTAPAGGVFQEIKSLRVAKDVFYPVGKVQGFDGTTHRQIYNSISPAQPAILNFSDQITAITGGYNVANKGGYAYTQGWVGGDNAWVMRYSGNNWSGAGWMQTKNKVEISGYRKLRLTGRTQMGYGDASKGGGLVYIALVNNPSGAGENAGGYAGGKPDNWAQNSWGDGQSIVKYVQQQYWDSTIALELDVSGVDGSYYIQIGRYNDTAYYTFSTFFQTLTFIE